MPRFNRSDGPEGMRIAMHTIDLLYGNRFRHKRTCLEKGERFHIKNRTNLFGTGRGLVTITNYWGETVGYVTPEQAEKLREEM